MHWHERARRGRGRRRGAPWQFAPPVFPASAPDGVKCNTYAKLERRSRPRAFSLIIAPATPVVEGLFAAIHVADDSQGRFLLHHVCAVKRAFKGAIRKAPSCGVVLAGMACGETPPSIFRGRGSQNSQRPTTKVGWPLPVRFPPCRDALNLVQAFWNWRYFSFAYCASGQSSPVQSSPAQRDGRMERAALALARSSRCSLLRIIH